MKSSGCLRQLFWPSVPSSVAKASWFVHGTGHCEPHSLPLPGCYWQPLRFFLVSSYPYKSQLCWSEWSETKLGPLCGAPKGWRRWQHIHSFFLSQEELILSGSTLLALSNASLEDEMLLQDEDVCSTVFLKFYKWTPELSQS